MLDSWLDAGFTRLNLGVDFNILRQIYRRAIPCQAIQAQYMARNQTVDSWLKEAEDFWAEVITLTPNRSNLDRRQLVEAILTPELLASVMIAAPEV